MHETLTQRDFSLRSVRLIKQARDIEKWVLGDPVWVRTQIWYVASNTAKEYQLPMVFFT